jgi:hypothetical protein
VETQRNSFDESEAGMSLKGQWIARYNGSNTGIVVIDIDEFGDHFAGTAVAWDDNPAHPDAYVDVSGDHNI